MAKTGDEKDWAEDLFMVLIVTLGLGVYMCPMLFVLWMEITGDPSAMQSLRQIMNSSWYRE